MKNVLIVTAVFLSLAITTSNINLQTTSETQPINGKNWMDFPLSLVNKANNKSNSRIKILTPTLMQTPKHVPTEFTVFATGKIEGIELTLIDENGNGEYNEIGTDLMVFGKSPYGVPLSKIVSINKKLYECKVAPKGDQISLTPYDGKYGILDFISNFKCQSKLDYAILNFDDIYIDVANDKNIPLPCGIYTFWLGYMREGTSHVTIKQNGMQSVEITDELNSEGQKKVTAIKWGASFRMDFQFTANNDKVTVSYGSIKVYGSSNEEYFNIFPSLSPQIEIKDSNNLPAVPKGAFPGC
ncbi:MAG: hypothetical protein V1871_00645 [Planctomycetota bacterium]